MRFLVLLALAALAAAQDTNLASPRFICDCPGEDGKDYVCGKDGQTWGNECILNCANVPLKNRGVCDNKGCFPYEASNCGGAFTDQTPTCTIGLTWNGPDEAKCAGTGMGAQCTTSGVCEYRADGVPNFLPTTGGKGLNWKDAAANTNLPEKTDPPYNYSEAIAKLLLYYDGLISGNLTAPGVCRRRLTWRSDSCFTCVGKYGEDLSGGFYESGGSTLKYPSIISGFSGTVLAWSGLEYGPAIERAGQLDDLKWKVKWAADHVINAHPQPEVFAAFIGNFTYDFDFYGPAEYFEKYNPARQVFYVTAESPGTEVVADAAATVASAIVLLGTDEPQWKAKAMEHAVQLYDFATKYKKSYSDNTDPGIEMMGGFYPSNNGFWDDLAWAAAWMYKATGNETYLNDAKEFLSKAPAIQQGDAFSTSYKTPGAAILLASINQDPTAMSISKTYFDAYLDGVVDHTAAGAAYPYHWSANRHVSNLGFLTMVHAKNAAVDPAYAARLTNYGMHQTNYLLGDAGRSWVIGFGKDFPTAHHHKFSHFTVLDWHPDPAQEPLAQKMWVTDVKGNWQPWNTTGYVMKAKFDFEGSRTPNRYMAWGTVFGAPLIDDGMVNVRRDYTYTESTTEYNAAAIGAVAALADWYSTGSYSVEGLDGVIPYTCDPPAIPFEVQGAASPSPALAPAPAPVSAPMPSVPSPQPAAVSPSPAVSPPPSSSPETTTGGAGGEVPAASGVLERNFLNTIIFVLFMTYLMV